MTASKAENIGCADYCKTGQVLAELAPVTSFRTTRLKKKAAAYLQEYPCHSAVAGNCRLDEFLIRNALGLSLKAARLEANEKYYDEEAPR